MIDWSEQADNCVTDRDEHEQDYDVGNPYEVERKNIPFKIDKKADIRRDLTPFECNVLGALKRASLEPRVYCLAISGSCYIKFAESRLCSLRIGNHKGIKKYRYKWNLRFDCKVYTKKNEDGVNRFYYPAIEYADMIQHIKAYQNKIHKNEKEENE